jgi:hypothetical protein
MSTLTMTAERIAAAGCSRAIAAPVAGVSGSAYAGSAAFAAIAAFRGWGSNPTQGMQVKATKRHDLTPAPRPEDGSP